MLYSVASCGAAPDAAPVQKAATAKMNATANGRCVNLRMRPPFVSMSPRPSARPRESRKERARVRRSPEVVTQVAAQVIGNDTAIAIEKGCRGPVLDDALDYRAMVKPP